MSAHQQATRATSIYRSTHLVDRVLQYSYIQSYSYTLPDISRKTPLRVKIRRIAKSGNLTRRLELVGALLRLQAHMHIEYSYAYASSLILHLLCINYEYV